MSPAVSKSQRKLMALAKAHPEEVYPKNRGVLKMSKKQLHDFASTKEKGLPEKLESKKAKKKHPRKRVSKKK